MVDPLGLGNPTPQLSWRLPAGAPGRRQEAYEIRVAGEGEVLWSTGIVRSPRSVHVPYSGPPLVSRQRCGWRVRVWCDGEVGPWSDEARWEMGLLSTTDWTASWAWLEWVDPDDEHRPATYLRRSFPAGAGVLSARLHATAHGVIELSCNGRRVSPDRFVPGFTDYHRRLQYRTYDITPLLVEGENVLGAVVGEGWWCGTVGPEILTGGTAREHYGERPEALLQAELVYADGRTETIATDSSWRGTFGPIVLSDLLMGETYDARAELGTWDQPGYDDSSWATPETRGHGEPPLVPSVAPPVRPVLEVAPQSWRQTSSGTWVADLGQNVVGWVRIRLCEPGGTTVRLRFAERLEEDGSLHVANLRTAKATDTYICRGSGTETYEPHFTFHGFQYVEVSGLSSDTDPPDLLAVVAATDLATTGSFTCSNDDVNQLQSNIVWGQRGNFFEVPTDCPQRDERLGWTGDAQVFVRTSLFNQDCLTFWDKWLHDLADTQDESGSFADVAPRYRGLGPGSPAWSDAGVIVPWVVYRWYGDEAFLSRHYDAARRWVDYVADANPTGLWLENRSYDFGDWVAVDPTTPKELLATAFHARSAELLARMAAVLGRDDDARSYRERHEHVRRAFQDAYVGVDGRVAGGTQTAYALALRFGLVQDELTAAAATHLVDDIRGRGGSLSCGFIGVRHLLPALTATGHLDVAYSVLENPDYPGWIFSVRQGATTIWERWDGWTPDRGFQDPRMNSFNHYSFGAVGEWLYETVAGIGPSPDGAGFQQHVIAPQPGGSLQWVDASYDSPYGTIRSAWRVEGESIAYDLEVPPNTEARVTVPGAADERIARAPGARLVDLDPHRATLRLQPGAYRLSAGWPVPSVGTASSPD